MKVLVTPTVNRLTAPAPALAADYKHRGLKRHEAWDRFIVDRGLRPEMDAKPFYTLFDAAIPAPIAIPEVVEFAPSHRDALLGQLCQVAYNEGGWWEIVWQDGRTGGWPTLTWDGQRLDGLPARFQPLEETP